ncbi:hypothetical protein K9M09_00300 [Patescibacteria group bacterium]|nr:hypothetical protein [Patescibacteria group bacterium]
MISFKHKIRIFWLVLLIIILLFLLWQRVSPAGEWTCRQNFSADSLSLVTDSLSGRSCLSRATPVERVISGDNGPLIVLADPVYFSVFTPRAFSRAELEIIYRPHLSSSTPIVEAGFLADSKLWRYDLQPVYNLWLEEGLKDWSSLSMSNIHLFQRQKKFDEIFDFLDAWQNDSASICATPRCLAVYNFDLSAFPPAINLEQLNHASESLFFPYTIRGAHQFYFYLSSSTLNLSGELIDRNEGKDKDPLELSVYNGHKLVASIKLEDNGFEFEGSGDRSESRLFQINKEDLTPGLYRLDLRSSDDVMIKNLHLNTQYLSALHKIWLESTDPVQLVTDAPYVQVKALDPTSLQMLNFDDKFLNIEEIYRQYEVKGEGADWYNIDLSRGGVILENNGVFALNKESLLNPDYPRLDRSLGISAQFDYILADYELAQKEHNNYLSSRLDFSTSNFYREKGRYNLILSIPGLKLDSAASGYLEIKNIKVRFYGNSLWFKIRNWLNL